MKKLLTKILPFILLATAHCDDLKLKNGKVLEDYRIINHSPIDATIIHKGGVENIPFKLLPDELQEKYGYQKQDAEKYQKESAKKEKENAERYQAQLEKRRAKQIQIEQERKLLEKATPMEFHVFQVYDRGLLVNDIVHRAVASPLARIGAGGNVASFKARGDKLFFVEGYPSGKVVDGDRIKGLFIEDGIYTYTTSRGSPKTVKKYRFLKNTK